MYHSGLDDSGKGSENMKIPSQNPESSCDLQRGHIPLAHPNRVGVLPRKQSHSSQK